jgi:hypothetical protein
LSLTAGQMQRGGAIQYRRGLITVVNRRELEKLSCECYLALRSMLVALDMV